MKPSAAIRDYLRSSLARKFVLAVILVNAVLVAMLGMELVQRDRAILDHHHQSSAATIARILATTGAPAVERGDRSELQRLAAEAAGLDQIYRIRFEDVAGHAIADSRDGANGLANPATPMAKAATVAIGADGEARGRVRVWIDRTAILTAQSRAGWFAIAYGAAIILLGGLVAFLTARSVTERLARLAKVADRFRMGDHRARLTDDRLDEVGLVSRGVNSMLDTIAASERSLNKVFRIAHIGSWKYQPSTQTLILSDTLREVLGADSSGPPPTIERFQEILSPRQRRKLMDLLESEEPDQTFSFNFTIPRADGTDRICWAEARTECGADDGEKCLIGFCQDITDRETAVAQLRQAQKMEAVGQLTGGIAHDFNNLLAVVIGNLDLLEEEFISGSSSRECIDEALAAALRGSELTRHLLAFSRRQSLSPRVADLNRMVAGMSALWRRTLGEAIEIRIRLAENLWTSKIDVAQVESAILNLAINARDAMPVGGVLTVETSNVSVEEDHSEPGETGLRKGDYILIAVSDTGSGMPPEVATRAFEPFFTTKPVGRGSGLGLSMIYGFAKQSGGTVRIYSEVGQGTTVRLYLPRHIALETVAEESPPDVQIPTSASETVLIVEDNDSVRRVAARQLGELGYSVLSARNGPEALEVLDGIDGVDLLFTDVIMPGGMNGFELARIATERDPGLRVLLTSGFTEQAAQDVAKGPAPGEVLAKPYRKVDLALKLREALERPADNHSVKVT